jgi:photosystem II stability/assembly factor-like uncharacterized protein
MKKITAVITALLTALSAVNAQWTQTNGPVGGRIYSLAVTGTTVFAGTNYGVFKSTNSTQTWFQTSLNNCKIKSIAVKDSNIYCGAETGGVFVSNDMGLSWTHASLNVTSVMTIAVCREYIFAGTYANGLYYSTNRGSTWSQSSLNLNVYSMAVYDSIVIAGTGGDGIYRSNDFGQTWQLIGLNNSYIWSISVNYPYIYASNVYTFLSPDFGQTWIPTSLSMESQKSIVAMGQNVFVAADLIQRSTDYGYTWSYVFNIHGTTALAYYGNSIVSGGSGGAYISSNNGNNWSLTPFNNKDIQSVIKIGPKIYAGMKISGGIQYSIDNGESWIQSSFNTGYVNTFLQNSTRLFAGSSNGVYFSTDNGQNWVQTSLNRDVRTFIQNGNDIFAGAFIGGVYKSTDNGESWIQTSLNNKCINTLIIKDQFIFAGAGYFGPGSVTYGVYKSADNGGTWTFTGFDYQIVSALAVRGTKIFAGTRGNQIGAYDGVYISTNNGESWILSSLHKYVESLVISGLYIFCATDSNGIYVSSDDGATWVQKNEGMGNQTVYSLFVTPDYVYAGTRGSSVWKRSFSEIISIKSISSQIPQEFCLYQNFPNPFNPVTKIKFDIPLDSRLRGNDNVVLKIFDILGREIAVLVNEQFNPGTYEVQWDASNYPSGVYFYRLISGNYIETRKMVLLR